MKLKNASATSLSSKHSSPASTSDSLQFPKLNTYYTYRPAGPSASLIEKLLAVVSLMYYKYLLHTGLYVMTKNEQRVVNLIVVVSVVLSVNQMYELSRRASSLFL